MKKLLMAAALILATLTFSQTASAQNGAFAPYVGIGVSGTAATGISSPSYNAQLGIESSSKYLLLDVNGNFNSNNPISAIKTCKADGASSTNCSASYASGIQGSAYVKLFDYFLVGGGASWDVNPSTIRSSAKAACTTAHSCVSAVTSNANPFVGGGLAFSHDRLLVNYVLPGQDAIQGQRAFNVHNEIFLAPKTHLRITSDFAFITGTVGTSTRVNASSGGIGLKLVL